MSRRRSLRAPEPIGEVVPRAPDLRGLRNAPGPPISARDWELAVGSKVARRARPTKLERGVLHVYAATATWAQELSMLADTIIAQLRARGIVVRSLRFHVGKVEPIARPAWRNAVYTAPAKVKLPPEVVLTLASVTDPELRAAIARAAAASRGQ